MCVRALWCWASIFTRSNERLLVEVAAVPVESQLKITIILIGQIVSLLPN